MQSEFKLYHDEITKRFSGGRYAVAQCVGCDLIRLGWDKLLFWSLEHHEHVINQPGFEKIIYFNGNPDDTLIDLYLPIAS